MGQATIDLPDPTHGIAPTLGAPASSTTAETPGNVDDLLAQMAGEEIDRLLSEADDTGGDLGDPPPRRSTEPLATLDAPPASATPSSEPFRPTELPPPITSRDARAPVATPTAAPASSAPSPHPEAQPDSAAEEIAQALADDETVKISMELEGALLGNTATVAEPATADDADAPGDAPLPFYLRPLAWMSLPLEAGPGWMRELVGKVALMTLLNATAVLVYVFAFRRHR